MTSTVSTWGCIDAALDCGGMPARKTRPAIHIPGRQIEGFRAVRMRAPNDMPLSIPCIGPYANTFGTGSYATFGYGLRLGPNFELAHPIPP